MKLRLSGIALAAAGVMATGAARACDVGAIASLRSANVESVTVQFSKHRPEMPLEDSRRVVALVGFLKRLGPEWAPGGASSSDGVIRFYEAGSVAASVFVGTDALATDSCKRKLSSDELDELFSILVEA